MLRSKLELWGGVECTMVRVGDEYRDQILETGHVHRASDLDLITELGIKTLRYPVLWEAVAPADALVCDWSWADKQLERLRELDVEVIAGLVHHGSGPRYANLLDPCFPEQLASYAGHVARRYPWINHYTPVNEPLTTARFSCLYGHWHPHAQDEGCFLRALLNECRGVALAMRAVRQVNPYAKLIQTEDLGKVFSNARLKYQADYENERRWLSLDLLMGQVGSGHLFYDAMLAQGVDVRHLDELREGEGAPDIVGINYYATSDRFLDSDLDRYSPFFAGGNQYERYADVEALRVELSADDLGAYARLSEAWARYKRPLAITESHHGSTRDEQVRWLMETWRSAEELVKRGVDVRAVTLWSLFGAVDWNSLLTRRDGFYEPGAFDVRTGTPRRTAVGQVAHELARNRRVDHPVLDQPGWWRRNSRFYHHVPVVASASKNSARPVLIFGGTGTLGRAFARICAMRGLDSQVLGRADAEISDAHAVENAVSRYRPWAIVNAAGYVRVADASRETDACYEGNVTGAVNIALVCARLGLQYVTFSSDLVFDGMLGRAYIESDQPNPLCVYGFSKAEAERQVAAVHADALVVRTSAFFGPWDQANFVWQSLRSLSEGGSLQPDSSIVSPTYVPDLVNATLDLLIDREAGVWHLANDGLTSWAELAERVAMHAGMTWSSGAELTGRQQVRSTALTSGRGVILPRLEDALARFFRECEVGWGSAGRV